MNNIHPHLPLPINEPIKSYAPNSPEKASLLAKLAEMKATHHEIGPIIGGETFLTNDTETLRPPHERKHTLGTLHHANDELVQKAIQVATDARHDWMRLHWTDRAAVFLKAADLLSTSWRDTLNAATMLGQSKNAFQAEIDAACELIDFLRFNVSYMQMVYDQQPISSQGIWNKPS
jgi:1-pyrroline-5-carboxylate dehydrogenase